MFYAYFKLKQTLFLTPHAPSLVMRTTILGILLIVSTQLVAQDISKEVRELFDKQEYREIINRYSENFKTLPYNALFDLGLSYYKLGKDKIAIEIMDECIRQNSNDSGTHYVKAKSLNFLGQYSKAIKEFEDAIKIEGGSG